MRCCYGPSSAAAATALLLACASTVAGDRVLVIGAQKDLVHDAVAADSNPSSLATAFTPAGLAGLAMDAFGLATGNLVRLSSGGDAATASQVAVSSPAQADVFARVDAYAVVLVDRADATVVDGVDAASTAGYHKVFELQENVASAKISTVIATELRKTAPTAEITCAGDDAVCGSSLLTAVAVAESDVDRVFQAYTFLERTVESDVVLAEQLAQAAVLTSGFKPSSSSSTKSLVVVSFSGVNALDEHKREAARSAVRDHIQRLLAALQTAYPTASGAQVVATKHGAVRALDATIAYSRMLLSFKEGAVGSADDEDDEDSGSSEGAGNATTSAVTAEDIAQYQIVLWTSVLLVVVLLLVILAMCNMEPKRDSLLYAKFTTSNAGRKYD